MFKKAKRIWLRGLSRAMNIQARFTCVLDMSREAQLYITGATFYKVYLDGTLHEFTVAKEYEYLYLWIPEDVLPANSGPKTLTIKKGATAVANA